MSRDLSLYIHYPWCIQKCPYCDFNSHQRSSTAHQQQHSTYLRALQEDITHQAQTLQHRSLTSIFFGGGTPSLMAASEVDALLTCVETQWSVSRDNLEITLEANPGSVEHGNLYDLRQAGVNRLSLGAQSFSPTHLQALGRIHQADDILQVMSQAHQAHFQSINIDIMYALPEQSLEQCLQDLEQACDLQPQHLSWYHLTLEPHTAFARRPPPCPDHDLSYTMMTEGMALLASRGYAAYEISAYAQPGHRCQHNLNVWRFGDYVGVGAGAHGKITEPDGPYRFWKHKHPKRYLSDPTGYQKAYLVPSHERLLEWMMNRARLIEPIPYDDYATQTGQPLSELMDAVRSLASQGWILANNDHLTLTEQGRLFLNEWLEQLL